MTSTRRPTTTAVVTDEDGRRTDVATFALGHWEKGALQVLLDAVRGQFGVEVLDFARLASEGTTLGDTPEAVLASLEHLGSLVRGFSQADDVVVTATVR